MSYSLIIDEKQGLLEVKHEGRLGLNEGVKARAEIARLVQQNSIRRLLFNFSDCNLDFSTSDIYTYGSSFEKAGIPSNLIIGGMVKHHDHKSRFLESVVQNRFIDIKFFTNREDVNDFLGIHSNVATV